MAYLTRLLNHVKDYGSCLCGRDVCHGAGIFWVPAGLVLGEMEPSVSAVKGTGPNWDLVV